MSDFYDDLSRDKSRRSMRIHHRDRVQRNFECLLVNAHSQVTNGEHISRWARYGRDNRASCSGWCCGNPRKWFNELTMQERRAALISEHKYQDEDSSARHADGRDFTDPE